MSTTERNRPRTLAEALRTWDDGALGHLLQRRPDLAMPIPADTGQLAARATTNASAARAINRLDEFGVDLLEALSALPEPVDLAALARRCGSTGGGRPAPGDRIAGSGAGLGF